MLSTALIGFAFATVFFAAWYWAFLRLNRRRGRRVLRWLQEAIAAHGQISGVTWVNPSQLRARLNLSGNAFSQPSLEVSLVPRHVPARWALWLFGRREETLTFQANLLCPPSESLEIGRTRWCTLNRRTPRNSGGCSGPTVATLFISSQPAWEPQLAGRIHCVASTRDFDFLAVSFRPRPPHFSVTLSLRETMRHPSGELVIFDSLRELAEGSRTSRL
jgi:hypothetical protein